MPVLLFSWNKSGDGIASRTFSGPDPTVLIPINFYTSQTLSFVNSSVSTNVANSINFSIPPGPATLYSSNNSPNIVDLVSFAIPAGPATIVGAAGDTVALASSISFSIPANPAIVIGAVADTVSLSSSVNFSTG